MHFGDGGKRAYWGGFFKAIVNMTKDGRAIFIDGSLGGVKGLVSNRYGISNHSAQSRMVAGKEKGRAKAKAIVSLLKETETIKVVTHSMGSAFAKGFITALIKYGEENGIDIVSRIEYELDLAPFQPYDQKAVDGVKTIFVQHYNDGIAGIGDIEGADIGKRLHRYRFSTGLEELRIELEEHSIESFVMDIEEIKLLINDMNKKPDGKER